MKNDTFDQTFEDCHQSLSDLHTEYFAVFVTPNIRSPPEHQKQLFSM